MWESIVCTGRIGTKPYRFPETGIMIFSYEELCYYISHHMICYLYSLPGEDLLLYLKEELGLEKLYRQLSKLTDSQRDQMKYFSALFREGNYFSEDEIRQILDKYRNLKNAPYALQCKWLGDVFLESKRASAAVKCYKRALRQETLKPQETGAVYHNMGIAQSRMFRFHEAKIAFVKAYQYGGDDESLFYYYCIVACTENMKKAEEELQAFKASDLMTESFENRFLGMTEEFHYSDMAAEQKKIEYLIEREKTERADSAYRRLTRDLQKEFRGELDTGEILFEEECLPGKENTAAF